LPNWKALKNGMAMANEGRMTIDECLIRVLGIPNDSDFRPRDDYCCCHIELQNRLGALRKYDTQEFYSKIINHIEKYGVI